MDECELWVRISPQKKRIFFTGIQCQKRRNTNKEIPNFFCRNTKMKTKRATNYRNTKHRNTNYRNTEVQITEMLKYKLQDYRVTS